MSVNAITRVIDVGLAELNDAILPQSVQYLAEQQNAVYRDSRSVFLSFVQTSNVGFLVFSNSTIMLQATDIPEGITDIWLTTRGTDIELTLYDATATVAMAVHTHGAAESTITSAYTLPATGPRAFTVNAVVASPTVGSVRQVTFEWYVGTLP
jgi:hypothetical protein